MLPDIEGQYRLKPTGDGVAGIGFQGDDEGAAGSRGEPDPAGAEEADALGDEVGLEGLEGAPLLLDLSGQRSVRKRRATRAELREIQVVVQDLAGVVEDGLGRLGLARKDDNLFEGLILQTAARQEPVQIVDIGLQVLAVVKADGLGTDNRRQGIGRIRELDECKHMLGDGIILLFPTDFNIDGKPARSSLSCPGKGGLELGVRT